MKTNQQYAACSLVCAFPRAQFLPSGQAVFNVMQMLNMLITNESTGHTTSYSPKQLRAEARQAVKGKGKLLNFWVHVQDGAPIGAVVMLTATFQRPDGWRENVNVAI